MAFRRTNNIQKLVVQQRFNNSTNPSNGLTAINEAEISREIKNNYQAIRDPNSSDNLLTGYSSGSEWVNKQTGILFKCVNSTITEAMWQEIVNSSSSNQTMEPPQTGISFT